MTETIPPAPPLPPLPAGEPAVYNPRGLPDRIERSIGYDAALANHVLDRLEEGQTLEKVAALDDAPAPATVLQWVRRCPDFSEAYREALEIRAEILIDQCVTIADRVDLKPTDKKQRIETRKDLAGFDNRRFVKRSATELSGPNGGPLHLRAAIVEKSVSKMSKEELAHIDTFFGIGPKTQLADAEKRKPLLSFSLPVKNLNHLGPDELSRALSQVPVEKLQSALENYNSANRK